MGAGWNHKLAPKSAKKWDKFSGRLETQGRQKWPNERPHTGGQNVICQREKQIFLPQRVLISGQHKVTHHVQDPDFTGLQNSLIAILQVSPSCPCLVMR